MRESIKYDIVHIAWSGEVGSMLDEALREAASMVDQQIRVETALKDNRPTSKLMEYLNEGIGAIIVDRNWVESLNSFAQVHPGIHDLPVIVIANENADDLTSYLNCHGGDLNYAGRLYIEEQSKARSLVPVVHAIKNACRNERGRITAESLRQALIDNRGEYIAYELPKNQASRPDSWHGFQSFLQLSRAYFNRGREYSLA